MTKRKGQDFTHKWTLQIQASSVCELIKFKSILDFWSIFNNLEEILSRIPAACRIDLFKSYAKPWWHDLPGGAWIIPLPFESVAHVFTEIAMVLVGEICNGSEHIYGLMLNWNLDGANEFWVWNYTDPPTSRDFVVRIRSILNLDDHHLIEFRSQKEFGFGAIGDSRKWSVQEEKQPEDSEQSELSELSNGPSDLSYDRQYLKRFAFSEASQELPNAIQNFDWSLLFLPPTTNAALPSFINTVSTWLYSSAITKWMALPPEDGQPKFGFAPVLNGELPQNSDNEFIKVAEACLDDLPESKEQAIRPSAALNSFFSEEGCVVCMLTQKFDQVIAFSCPDRGCLHAMHRSCADEAPSLDRLHHAPFQFNVERGTLEYKSLPLATDPAKVMIVHIELRHLLGHRSASTVDISASVYFDASIGCEGIHISMGISPKIIAFCLSRARLAFNFKIVATGLHWNFDVSFDVSNRNDLSDILLSFSDSAGQTELSTGLVRVKDGFEMSGLQFRWKKTRSIPSYRTGGGPVRPSTPEQPMSSSLPSSWSGSGSAGDLSKEIGQRSKLQLASRVLQEELTSASPEKFASAFDALLPQLADLVMDSFGHYTAEKISRLANTQQRIQLLRALEPRFAQIACHKLGSFSLQSIMETLQSEQEVDIFIEILRPNVQHIVSNPSGHYVLLRCLDLLPYPSSKFIFDAATGNVVAFSTDHYGLRVMKVLVQVPRNPSVDRLLEEIAANTLLLVENQYGNYVIQLVLTLEGISQELTDAIFSQMVGRFAKLSKQKFSSNAVEQCLRRGSPGNRSQVIKELIVAVNLLIRDRFGNYVLQTALECSTKPQTVQLGNAIAKSLHLLRDNVRAKWIGILRDKLGEHADSILSH